MAATINDHYFGNVQEAKKRNLIIIGREKVV